MSNYYIDMPVTTIERTHIDEEAYNEIKDHFDKGHITCAGDLWEYVEGFDNELLLEDVVPNVEDSGIRTQMYDGKDQTTLDFNRHRSKIDPGSSIATPVFNGTGMGVPTLKHKDTNDEQLLI